jgi:hypothetical protein
MPLIVPSASSSVCCSRQLSSLHPGAVAAAARKSAGTEYRRRSGRSTVIRWNLTKVRHDPAPTSMSGRGSSPEAPSPLGRLIAEDWHRLAVGKAQGLRLVLDVHVAGDEDHDRARVLGLKGKG